MKKQNNRYRNGNNNNNGYTLNYKFDSVSIAGKISGTALDLIRRYNDLAKEAQTCGNYVDMEIYRQYAEHYRKIVTEINERRQNRNENQYRNEEAQNNEQAEVKEESESTTSNNTDKQEPTEVVVAAENGYVETLPATEPTKTLHVVEITEENNEDKPKTKRVYRRKTPIKKTSEA